MSLPQVMFYKKDNRPSSHRRLSFFVMVVDVRKHGNDKASNEQQVFKY